MLNTLPTYKVNKPLDQTQKFFEYALQNNNPYSQYLMKHQMRLKKNRTGILSLKFDSIRYAFIFKYKLVFAPVENTVTGIEAKPRMTGLLNYSFIFGYVILLFMAFILLPQMGFDQITFKAFVAVMYPIIYVANYSIMTLRTYKKIDAFMNEYISAISQIQ